MKHLKIRNRNGLELVIRVIETTDTWIRFETHASDGSTVVTLTVPWTSVDYIEER